MLPYVKSILTTTILMLPLTFAFAAEEVDHLAEFKKSYTDYNECLSRGDKNCALSNIQLAFDHGSAVFKPDGKNMAGLTYALGKAQLNADYTRNKESSYTLLKKALTMHETLYGEDSEDVLLILIDLTHAQMDLSESEKKKNPYWRRAEKLSKNLYGKYSIVYAEHLTKLGNGMLFGYSSGTSIRKAVQFTEKAYEIYKSQLGEESPSTAMAALNIGKYKLSNKRNKEAIEYFNAALKGFDITESRNRYAVSTHAFLVKAYEESGESEKATEHCLAIGQATPITAVEDYYPIYKKAPKYPQAAARSQREGHVIVEYVVDELGFTQDIKVVEWNGSKSFIEPSIEAAQKFRYAPGFVDGKAVKTPGVRNKFTFKMSS